MAKIVRFHHVGGPEVLHIEEAPARPPAQGEVRLRVQAMLSSPATWRAGHAEARLTECAGPVPQASDQGGDRDARGHGVPRPAVEQEARRTMRRGPQPAASGRRR
jgi:NADPH:quinone reductase-like Zn-dependent oxidoreductase